MLEEQRKRGASIIIYALFGTLIAVFVINFGAQSVGTSEGCRSSSSERVATVDGHDVGTTGWHWAGNFLSNFERGVSKDQRAATALEWLIVREILVQEAESRGLDVDDKLVDANLVTGKLYFQGQVQEPLKDYFIAKDGTFINDPDKIPPAKRREDDPPGLVALVRQVGLSMGSFKEQQRKETLAAMMIQMIMGEPRASKDEAFNRFVFENTKVAFDVVAFSPDTYGAALQISDADVARWMGAHEAEIKAQFDKDQKQLYTGRKPEVHVREIFIPKPTPPEDAGSGSGSASAAPAPKDDGADKLAAAKTSIEAKKETFADAAKRLDFNEGQRARGGDVGWRTLDSLALGDPKLDDAVRGLKPGAVSDVVTTDDGHYLLTVEDKREGNLAYDTVKREIATTLARKAWGDEAAKRAALAALDQTKQGKKLRDLFPVGRSPEEKQRIQQEMQMRELERLQQQNGQSGRIEWESPDVPAVWGADDQKAPAGGSAAAPAAPVEIKATAEALPTIGEVKPEVIPYTGMRRTGGSIGFTPSPEITTALFDQLGDGQVAPKVFLDDGQYVVIQLVKKDAAQVDTFEKRADDAVADLVRERGIRLLTTWLHDRCHALYKDGKITFEAALVSRSDETGKAMPTTYRPCQSLDTEDDLPPLE